MSQARDYQIKGKNELRQAYARGSKRVIWWMPTGTGKTFCFNDLAKDLVNNGKKVIIIIKRRGLIFQTHKSLLKFTGIDASIVMGSEKGFDAKKPVQIVSIDTINRRINKPEYKFLLSFDWLICDEGHDCTSKKYRDFLNLFSEKYWTSFTATPFNTGNQYLTDWEDIISPISAKEARDRGYLVPERTYAPKKIDTSGIKTRLGEFDQKELAKRAMDSKIVGDTVEVYQSLGESRPAFCYAVNIEHSKLLAERFRQEGVSAIHIDQSHSTKERDLAISGLKSGYYKVLCSVNVFSTGTDVPIVSCGIFARPTKSEILYVQQIGRILRPYKKCARCGSDCGAENNCFRCEFDKFTDIKKDAIILDQANNCERFGLAYSPRFPRIRPPTKKRTSQVEVEDYKTKTCEQCFSVYEAENTECPVCGHINKKTEREIKEEEGELERKKESDLAYSRMLIIKNELMKLDSKENRFNWKPVKKWIELYYQFGEEIFEHKEGLECPRWVKSQLRKLGVRKV